MKVKLGALIDSVSGKIGGSVGMKGKSGFVFRTKVRPRNPQTSYQTTQRNNVYNLSKQFATLTPAQISDWNETAARLHYKGIYGDTFSPSGINLFLKQNCNTIDFGGTAATDPVHLPATPLPMTLNTVAADASAHSLIITFSRLLTSGEVAIVEVTAQQSPGVASFKGKYRMLLRLTSANTDLVTGHNCGTTYEARFGTLATGSKISVQVMHSAASDQTVKYKAGGPISAIIVA